MCQPQLGVSPSRADTFALVGGSTACPSRTRTSASPAKHRVAVFLSFLALTLALMIALLLIDVPLQTTAAPKGIVSTSWQAASTEAQRILDSWNPTARLYAAFSLGLDYLYMPAYAIVIGLACAWAAERWRSRRRGWLARGGVGAGLGIDRGSPVRCSSRTSGLRRRLSPVRRARAVAGASRGDCARGQVPADRRRNTGVCADRRRVAGRIARLACRRTKT